MKQHPSPLGLGKEPRVFEGILDYEQDGGLALRNFKRFPHGNRPFKHGAFLVFDGMDDSADGGLGDFMDKRVRITIELLE